MSKRFRTTAKEMRDIMQMKEMAVEERWEMH